MNTFRRPMFRGGKVDSRGTGITSGLSYNKGGRVGYQPGGPVYKFSETPIARGIGALTNEFNNNEPEFLTEVDEQGNPLPNPNYKYQFKHVLNIGNGDHVPIMNYTFDRITDGRNNQSIILKLYDALPTIITNLSHVTIEREVLTTQVQNTYYFSDVAETFFGDGLVPDLQENWINPDNNQHGFQSLDELAISKSMGDIAVDGLISSSDYDYPNLNTDFSQYANHTFFGCLDFLCRMVGNQQSFHKSRYREPTNRHSCCDLWIG